MAEKCKVLRDLDHARNVEVLAELRAHLARVAFTKLLGEIEYECNYDAQETGDDSFYDDALRFREIADASIWGASEDEMRLLLFALPENLYRELGPFIPEALR